MPCGKLIARLNRQAEISRQVNRRSGGGSALLCPIHQQVFACRYKTDGIASKHLTAAYPVRKRRRCVACCRTNKSRLHGGKAGECLFSLSFVCCCGFFVVFARRQKLVLYPICGKIPNNVRRSFCNLPRQYRPPANRAGSGKSAGYDRRIVAFSALPNLLRASCLQCRFSRPSRKLCGTMRPGFCRLSAGCCAVRFVLRFFAQACAGTCRYRR